tara:strand:+ start:808 stop:1242 length:435 start_codon:yes stop_codon:yes gene_type:complete
MQTQNATALKDLERVYHLIISEGGNPDKYVYHMVKRYRSLLVEHDKSPNRYSIADSHMEKNYAGIWERVKEIVWQTVDDELITEALEKRITLSGELFLKKHMCHTDEIWYAEDAMGNPIGNKPRCPECVHVKDSLNRIYGKRKF